MQGKLITLTGVDMIGKETQSGLLKEAFRRNGLAVAGMSFPEYGAHWAAEFVRATLNEEFITIHRQGGQPLTVYPKKQPNIFQMWQSADRIDRQGWINETLKTTHIIADRYEIDALAFGLVDGCDRSWLDAMNRLYRPSDLAIMIVGAPFPRPGEKADLNERDPAFQARVRRAYEDLHAESPWNRALINVDEFRCVDANASKHWVHRAICSIVRSRLGITLGALDYAEIANIETERLG